MWIWRPLILGLSLMMAACAGTDSQLRILEQANAFQIEPSQNRAAYDYVVRIKNAWDVDYDLDDRETRQNAALRGMKAQCPSARIVGEDVIQKGTYGITTRPVREYFIKIKCI